MLVSRRAQSPEIINVLLRSPILAGLRGHDVSPSWANGAKLFVPLTEQQVRDIGVELHDWHVIAYRSDVNLLKAALKDIPCRQRPKHPAIRRDRKKHSGEEAAKEDLKAHLAFHASVEPSSAAAHLAFHGDTAAPRIGSCRRRKAHGCLEREV